MTIRIKPAFASNYRRRKTGDVLGEIIGRKNFEQKVLDADTGIWSDLTTEMVQVRLASRRIVWLVPGTYEEIQP